MSDLYTDDIQDEPIAPYDDETVHYFCKFTFGQFFTIMVLLVITVCCTFYLGARYGNQYLRIADPVTQRSNPPMANRGSSSDVSQELAKEISENEELKEMARGALRQQENQRLQEKVDEYLSAPVDSQALNNHRAPQDDNIREIESERPIVGSDSPSEVFRNTLPPEPDLPGEYDNINNSAQIATRDGSVPVGQPLQRVGGGSGSPYSVQIGSYRDLSEASARVSEWKIRGYPAYMMEADIPGKGHYYRVRLGAFSTRQEADTFLNEMKQSEAIDGIIVTNP